jgi:uncharacterized protein YmfQ (DUF2313 family)
VQVILDSLNADRGTAYDAATSTTTVYVENMAIARAVAAAWGTNERLGNLWVAGSMTDDVLERWERILAINPPPTDTGTERRERIAALFARFGQPVINGYLSTILAAELGDVFVAVESISYANARILVPDASYPWGVVVTGGSPWSSTVAHVMVRLQKPTGWTEREFYDAAGQVLPLLDPLLPVWATVDWYRPGAVSVAVSGGPSAGGFYLDEALNLDNQVFAT